MQRELPVASVLAGRYRIEERIGAGGAGITYRAVDTVSAEPVVIKEHFPAVGAERDPGGTAVVPTEDAEQYWQSLRRAQAEEASLRALDLDGVVAIRDAFESNGTAYIVMDLVEGATLDEVIRKGLDPDHGRAILRWLCEVLGTVHEHGLVHQDLTPRNVMIQPDGRPVLIDFGLARTAGADRTHHGGTRAYAAPEQVLPGPEASVSPRSDVWALGLIAAQVLAGPFDVAQFDPESLRDRLSPSEVEAIIRARQVDPARRPADADDFAEALFAEGGAGTEAFGSGGLTAAIGLIPRVEDVNPSRYQPPEGPQEGGLTGQIGSIARPGSPSTHGPTAEPVPENEPATTTPSWRGRRIVAAVIVAAVLAVGGVAWALGNGSSTDNAAPQQASESDIATTTNSPTTTGTRPSTTAERADRAPTGADTVGEVEPPDDSWTTENRARAERDQLDLVQLGMTFDQVTAILGPHLSGWDSAEGVTSGCHLDGNEDFWQEYIQSGPGHDWRFVRWDTPTGHYSVCVTFREDSAAEVTWEQREDCNGPELNYDSGEFEEGDCESRTFSVLGNDGPISRPWINPTDR